MDGTHEGLPIVAFATPGSLRSWLVEHHATSSGVWVRLRRTGSAVPSVTFHDLLRAGLCFGWSESTRHAGDDDSYLQRFTPRRRIGTVSPRNVRLAEELIASGEMTPAGLLALGWDTLAPPD